MSYSFCQVLVNPMPATDQTAQQAPPKPPVGVLERGIAVLSCFD